MSEKLMEDHPNLANGHDERRPPGYLPPRQSVNAGELQTWALELTRASDIEPEPISWLWPGYLARGKLHILAGMPSAGKTTLAMKIAAIVSAALRWPDGGAAKQGNVIVWSGDDDPADTLVPRLEASGADMTRVFFARGMTCGKERRAFDPAKDIPALEAAIERAGGVALIVVDPLVSATSSDSHNNAETRRGLQPLVDLAAKCKAALLGVHHFTKGSAGAHPIDRVTGSVAFAALARIVLIAARHQDGDDGEPGQRILMRAKSNIGPDDGGFNYELQVIPMRENPEIIVSVVQWRDAISGKARDILHEAESIPDKDEHDERREATEFLTDFLSGGPKPQKEIKEAATPIAMHGAQSGGLKRTSGLNQARPQ